MEHYSLAKKRGSSNRKYTQVMDLMNLVLNTPHYNHLYKYLSAALKRILSFCI